MYDLVPSMCADFSSICEGYLWKLYSNCNMSWTYGGSVYWNPCQRNCWLVKTLLLDFSVSVFHVRLFDILILCSGGVSVSGYLQFQLQYLL